VSKIQTTIIIKQITCNIATIEKNAQQGAANLLKKIYFNWRSSYLSTNEIARFFALIDA